jgi:chemotaxis protein CheD
MDKNENSCVAYTDDNQSVFPGEIAFANSPLKLRTVLGSCIAITVWHPAFRYGGICHYLMVKSQTARTSKVADFRYAEDAVAQLSKMMIKVAPVDEYNASIWGGSQMFGADDNKSIGAQNQQFARMWIAQNKIRLKHVDVGGNFGRTLVFDLSDGCCYLKKYKPAEGRILYDN